MALPSARQPDPHRGLADRLRDIEAVTDAALSRLDEQTLLEALLERVKKVLQADTAAVLLLDQSASQLVATAASGIEEEVRQGVRIPLGAGFAGRVASSGEPVILATVDHTTVRNPLLVDRGIKSLLGVPLLAGGKVIGVLHVGSLEGRSFSHQDTELLRLAADRAALALQSLMSQDDARAAVALHRSLMPATLPGMPGLDLAAQVRHGLGERRRGLVRRVRPAGREARRRRRGRGRVGADGRGHHGEDAQRAARLRAGDRGPGGGLGHARPQDSVLRAERDGHRAVRAVRPGGGRAAFSSAGHPPPVLAVPGQQAASLSIRPSPPIGIADDPQRRSVTAVIPPGALLCCYTDGLVERRDQAIDVGISRLAASLDEVIAARGRLPPRDAAAAPAEDACAAVMRALVGSAPAQDDIALLVLHRRLRPGPA